MCGRYAVTLPLEAMRQLFRFDGQPNLMPNRDIRPTDPVPVIRQEAIGRTLVLMRWGLVPRFSAAIGPKPLINARAETLTEKPSFSQSLDRRRCLVPMDYYYEWKKTTGPKGIPFIIQREDEAMMAAAGLWDTWRGPDGRMLDSMAIITTTPDPEISDIHDRMPVMIEPEDYDLWLDTKTGKAQVQTLLTKRGSKKKAVPVAPIKPIKPILAQGDLFGSQ
jgi:putative SOS response-associated peptidase YedK